MDLDNVKASNVGDNSSFAWITLRPGTFTGLDGGAASEPVYGTQVLGHTGMSVSNLVQDRTRSQQTKRLMFFSFPFSTFISMLGNIWVTYTNGEPAATAQCSLPKINIIWPAQSPPVAKV